MWYYYDQNYKFCVILASQPGVNVKEHEIQSFLDQSGVLDHLLHNFVQKT